MQTLPAFTQTLGCHLPCGPIGLFTTEMEYGGSGETWINKSPPIDMKEHLMELLASNWTFDVERGPDCLFIRLRAPKDERDYPSLAEDIWQQLTKHLVYRLVLDMQDVPTLRSQLIGQLVSLRKRIKSHDGMLRLCGLSDYSQRMLKKTNLDEWLSFYPDREAAVMGRPVQPR